ncbi:MAG TPA: PIN domain-containing protein [Blastocatellia bacterium]|nr:PIN domain-containing protein [Blastocatellia bacterium]
MANTDFLIFLDANQYLDFYRTIAGRKLLDALIEQSEFIFVSAQIVEEVQRNKLTVAADFFRGKLEQLKINEFSVPDHLLELSAETSNLRDDLRKINEDVKKIKKRLETSFADTLQKISRSEDGVSKALDQIFKRAVPHTDEVITLARRRKEFGTPPGKRAGPLGDQITWELLLAHSKDTSKVWIISKDSDYLTKGLGKLF